ncbi:DNA-dependent metalloprotease WSS1 [Pseudozyma hubeiensis]|nr:DNA-dependent metalloprotease WSS1 [Pseudozyma hubeiensis]
MVHLRLNDSDTSRNKHINYITALPGYANTDQAHHRLQQLAAQVQPVMKQHGFQINSLEEFEWNREFAGRNWNNGETVELVLRRQDGSFAPLQWVLMVFCHELAHIKYMNHIPTQHGKLDRELRNQCRELQARGYYGDGFWSAGQRLEDNAFVAGSGISSLQGLPEYSCGGAYRSKSSKGRSRKRRRTAASTRSRGRGFKGPSLHTGAQTAPNTKGGRRVQSSLPGRGSRVDGNNHIPTASALNASYKDDVNSTFRKRTQTASARELRAQAALRRLTATKSEDIESKPAPNLDSFWPPHSDSGSSASFGGETDRVKEEDGESTEDESDTEDEDEDEEDSKEGGLVIRLDDSSSDEADRHNKGPSGASSSSNDGTVRVKQEPHHSTIASTESHQQRLDRSRLYHQHQLKQGGTLRSTNEDWQDFCSIASLPTGSSTAPSGPAARFPTPFNNSKNDPIELVSSDEEDVKPAAASKSEPKKDTSGAPPRKEKWSCQVCTLLNSPTALRCDACLTTKGSFLVGQ